MDNNMKKQYYIKSLSVLLMVIFVVGMLCDFYVPGFAADTTFYETLMASESLEAMDYKLTNNAVKNFTKEQALNLITRTSALYYSLYAPTSEQGQIHFELLKKYYDHPELVAERTAEIEDGSYQTLTQTSGKLSGGKYRLKSDLYLTDKLEIDKGVNVTIDLNGYAIIATTKNCIIYLENSRAVW